MTITQAIGYKLLNTTAVSAIVGTRAFHGDIPASYMTGQTVIFPAINFFELPGDPIVAPTKGEYERRSYQISCRDYSAKGAKDLADQVEIAFQNLQESVNGFDVQFVQVTQSGGVITEPDGKTFHSPVTIRLIFESDET